MEWQDEGIVLGHQRQGETSLIISVLTREHGRHKGMVRGGARSRQRGLYEAGTLVTASWSARLGSHLGIWRLEAVNAVAARLLDEPLPLACLSAAASLAETATPERVPYPALFASLTNLLQALGAGDGWAPLYLRWELDLLAELGYGLDFSACTVTGATENLSWVSPRTGRAVSLAAGADYADRLLILPRLLGGLGRPGVADPGRDLMDGLALTGHFLDRHLFAARAKIPASRGHFMDRLRRLTET